MAMPQRNIQLYDTTLRDGAQGEGIQFSASDKLRIAERLDEFGMHYIEGGWPGSNPKDMEFFKAAAGRKWAARLAAFGSTRRVGVQPGEDPQVLQLLEAETPVVTLVGKSSLLHVAEILKTSAEENLAMIRDTVAFLKEKGREVLFDAEHFFDGFKDNPEYALACARAAREGGAAMAVLCDTNGGSLPSEVGRITGTLAAALEGWPVGIHTHDDSGLGAANALAAVEAGASQVQGTINGYGERTGNCNLVTVIPNLQLKLGLRVVSDEDLAQLRQLSLFVDDIANQHHDPRAPFVGLKAFAHKGGLHTNAVRKLARSYEHIRPEQVGNRQRVLVGELSGRASVFLKAQSMGVILDEKAPETRAILDRIKELEQKGYEFEAADASFELLVRKELGHHRPFFELDEYHVSIRRSARHGFDAVEATVKLLVNGERSYTVAEGDGPVNALDLAMRAALRRFYPELDRVRLIDYKVRILDAGEGTDARTRVLVTSTDGLAEWTTVGVSGNVVQASWQALADGFAYFLLKSGR